MKTKYLLINLFLIITYSSFCQITITTEDGLISTDSLPYAYIKNPGTEMPQEGENIVWDYTHLVACDNCERIIHYQKTNDNPFSGSQYFYNDETTLLGSPILYQRYYGYDEAGDFYQYGSIINKETISLRNFAGNSKDKLTRKRRVLERKDLITDFPIEYGKSWKIVRNDTSYFKLNAPTIKLKEVNIQEAATFTHTTNIVGYGDLKLSYIENGETKTVTYKALLKKEEVANHFVFSSDLNKKIFNAALGRVGIKNNHGLPDCVEYQFVIKELAPYVLSFSKCKDSKTPEIVLLRIDLGDFPPQED